MKCPKCNKSEFCEYNGVKTCLLCNHTEPAIFPDFTTVLPMYKVVPHFIELTNTSDKKFTININHIVSVIYMKENMCTINCNGYTAMLVKESYEQVKKLINLEEIK